ncbi:MAG: SPOR domain-containing protein [Flavobacteriales bacterium]|nr:SPOR domain-containing protein [Flavobacteriales bacterium]
MSIELGDYVGELLYDNDCVIIPDFGGIVANIRPASILKEKDAFKPAFKQLSFNVKLKANDGLLINHIAQLKSIDYKKANEIVSDGVKAYQVQLDTIGSVNIVSVGTVSKDSNGRLSFLADENQNYLASAFGLGSFTSPKIIRDNVVLKIEKKLQVVKGASKRPPSKKWFITAAAAAVTVPMLLFVSLPYFQSNGTVKLPGEMSSMEVMVDTQKELSIPKKGVAIELQADVTDPIEEEKIIEVVIESLEPEVVMGENHKVSEAVPAPISDKYHIIGGSFGKRKNADKMVKKLKKAGYDALIVGQSASGSYRVSYGGYSDMKAAEYNLLVVQINFNKSAWLFTN